MCAEKDLLSESARPGESPEETGADSTFVGSNITIESITFSR
jgi:hypothetical protein